MSRKTNPVVAGVWRDRLERQACGSWSVAEFCRIEGVSQGAFYRWRKRLGKRPELRRSDGREPCVSDRQPMFVPVEVTSPVVLAGVIIELPSGAVVRLPHDASVEVLAAAVQAACWVHSGGEVPSC